MFFLEDSPNNFLSYTLQSLHLQLMDIIVGDLKQPNIIKLSSSGPTSEKYPESFGEYQLLQDISHNGRPVYQSLARDDRYIVNIGEYIVSKYRF